MEYNEDQIKSIFEKLPEDLRASITSVGVANGLQGIGKKYKLHIDKINGLFDETTLVMLGLTHPKDYLTNLKNRLQIPEDLAREIVDDVNEQIFRPIRASLMKIHNMSEGEESQPAKNESGTRQPISGNEQQITDNLRSVKTASPSNLPTIAKLEILPPKPETTSQEKIPILASEDEEILAKSGIEVERKTINDQQLTNAVMPKKEEIFGAIEKLETMPKGEQTLPAGFAVVRRQTATPIIPPDEKLSGPTKTGLDNAVYQKKSLPEKPPAPTEKKIDPYREPID